MPERWAVACGACGEDPGRFQWLRDRQGTIVVFPSKWQAKKWVLTMSGIDQERQEIVFVKLGTGCRG
ncbi:MAG TPA: hypothetical protein PKM41_16220 [Deltaproteobacteria bacterium]|mgnify:CR=1 FL=1|jgi:hypothetical protein|nr:hypothetical protein [Deltaproteobacteria bacterium]